MEKTMILDAQELGVKAYFVDDDEFTFGVDMNSEKALKFQEEAYKAWQQLYVTDFADSAEVVDLLMNLQPYTENAYVQLPINQLLSILKSNGYKANDCSGEAFNAEIQENFSRYLIGQAIANLAGYWGGILPTFVSHAKDFKAKFNLH